MWVHKAAWKEVVLLVISTVPVTNHGLNNDYYRLANQERVKEMNYGYPKFTAHVPNLSSGLMTEGGGRPAAPQ